MISPAASALEALARTNLRSRKAVQKALPLARDAAHRVQATMLEQGENPFEEINQTSAIRASVFVANLCESALLNFEETDLDHALWLNLRTFTSGVRPAYEPHVWSDVSTP